MTNQPISPGAANLQLMAEAKANAQQLAAARERIEALRAALWAFMEARAWEDWYAEESCYYCKFCDGRSERSDGLMPADVEHAPSCPVVVAKKLLEDK